MSQNELFESAFLYFSEWRNGNMKLTFQIYKQYWSAYFNVMLEQYPELKNPETLKKFEEYIKNK